MRRRQTYAAGFAVVLFVVGQLTAIRHEAESRHVTCAEHGEELEAPTLHGQDDQCGQSHWVQVDGDGGSHQDCAIARLLRTSTQTSPGVDAHVAVDVVAHGETAVPVAVGYAIDVLLIAPKTSPPV